MSLSIVWASMLITCIFIVVLFAVVLALSDGPRRTNNTNKTSISKNERKRRRKSKTRYEKNKEKWRTEIAAQIKREMSAPPSRNPNTYRKAKKKAAKTIVTKKTTKIYYG